MKEWVKEILRGVSREELERQQRTRREAEERQARLAVRLNALIAANQARLDARLNDDE